MSWKRLRKVCDCLLLFHLVRVRVCVLSVCVTRLHFLESPTRGIHPSIGAICSRDERQGRSLGSVIFNWTMDTLDLLHF